MASLWTKKRGLVETVIGIKKKELDLEHTRHQSIINAFTHMYAALAAYYFRTDKPKTNIHLKPFLLTNHNLRLIFKLMIDCNLLKYTNSTLKAYILFATIKIVRF